MRSTSDVRRTGIAELAWGVATGETDDAEPVALALVVAREIESATGAFVELVGEGREGAGRLGEVPTSSVPKVVHSGRGRRNASSGRGVIRLLGPVEVAERGVDR